MEALARTIRDFLTAVVGQRIQQSTNERIQPVFVGPPTAALHELFDLLTNAGTADWELDFSGESRQIVVLLVDAIPRDDASASPRSQRCNWDYAVTVRNSTQVSVTLVVPPMWDSRPESMANATDVLGAPPQVSIPEDYFRADPWPFVIRQIAQFVVLPVTAVRAGLRVVYSEAHELLPQDRDQTTWSAADRLLRLQSVDELPFHLGLPKIDGMVSADTLRGAGSALNNLAKVCSAQGFDAARQKLNETADALGLSQGERDSIRVASEEMFRHLRRQAGTAASFSAQPTAFFRDHTAPNWWHLLSMSVLDRLLRVRPNNSRAQRLRVTISGALNLPSLPGEPVVVAAEVRFLFPHDVGTVQVSRALPRQRATVQWSGDAPDWRDDPPRHNAPITYRVEATGYSPWSMKVLSLESYGLSAFARIEGAATNPVATGVGKQPEQSVGLDRTGMHRLKVFAGESVQRIRLTTPRLTHELSAPFTANLDCEHGDEFAIVAVGTDGEQISDWTLKVVVQEPEGIQPTSRFQALIVAHQQDQRRVQPVVPVGAANLRRLEELWLAEARSWRGVLAAWSADSDALGYVDWNRGTIGDLRIALDIRPPLNTGEPPVGYLEVRDAVRRKFQESGRTIAEADLTGPEWTSLLTVYVSHFRNWYTSTPGHASWADAIAVHAPIQGTQARQEVPTYEPIAFLLTPLHPLRLAWHAAAQRVLNDALHQHRCPSAGMLNPHGAPCSIGVEFQGHERGSTWRGFFGSGANDPHWALFWNRNHLRHSDDRTLVLDRLRWLGLEARSLTPGFTESQAMRSLEAVSTILPARVSLRVGLIGSTQESDACVDGILHWCESALTNPENYSIPPKRCDVYDLRANPRGPNAATLANVADQTNERVRWFRREPVPPTLDVVVLDQLGTLEPRGVSGSNRSVITPDTLFRMNLRNDLSNGLLLQETRVAQQRVVPNDELEAALLAAVVSVEASTVQDQQTALLEFRPNQEAIGQRLGQALFVATTSSQLDPACLIRSVRNQQGYLWDYDLPGIIGLNEERAGYYLIASPPPALLRAIASATRLVTDQEQQIAPILEEISRRGIPVLKRMAAGGNQARGEVGVLLTVRLLQDAFRNGDNAPIRLPVAQGGYTNFILPLDPYWAQLVKLRHALAPESSEQHPDLIVFSIRTLSTGQFVIRVTPLEVKFRTERLSSLAITQALQQAASLGALLQQLWTASPLNNLWRICGRALLAQCLDHCFRIYADSTLHGSTQEYWSTHHESVLSAVLAGTADITVAGEGRAVIIDGSPASGAYDFDGDRRVDTIVVSRLDARALMEGTAISDDADRAVGLLQFAVADQERARQTPHETPMMEASSRPDSQSMATTTAIVESYEGAPEWADDSSADTPQNAAQNDTPQSGRETIRPDAIDPSIRARVRSVFLDFVGNDAAVHRISNDLIRALIELPPHLAKNYLFTGQPSTGKTELARRMALGLNLPFVRLDGRGVASRDRMFELIEQEVSSAERPPTQVGQSMGLPMLDYPAMVIFIDEVHLMPGAVQESLLTMLEAGDRRVALRTHVALVGLATFLFATTRPSELDAAFRSRCTEVPLREYELGEVATMLERRFPHAQWPPEVFRRVATLGRLVPRVAIELAREFETEITVSEHQERSPLEHLDEVRRAREIDSEGLTREDLRYLAVLAEAARPIGEAAIINMVGTVDRDRVTNEIEPFLRRLGFIRFGPRGREITVSGREYLVNSRRDRML